MSSLRNLTVVAILLALTSAAHAEEPTRFRARVQKVDGVFNTYSVPKEDSVWTFDLDALKKGAGLGKITFTYADSSGTWYLVYRGAFRVVHEGILDQSQPVLRTLRLVNDTDGYRTTITLTQWTDKHEQRHLRGFVVFEKIDAQIDGMISFGYPPEAPPPPEKAGPAEPTAQSQPQK